MTNAKLMMGTAVAQAMSLLPVPFLRNLELAAQLGQGKGWGTSTVKREVAAALSLLADEMRQELHAVDVGANNGDWSASLLEALPGVSILAFEPSSVAFSRLQARFETAPAVELRRCALGRSEGTAMLWADTPGSAIASLERRRLDHHGLQFDHSEEVAVSTLDVQVGPDSRPALLKMDVEGRELDVLHGAPHVLESVRVIQFEFGGCNIDSRTYFQDFWYFLRHEGFAVYRLGPRGLRRMRSYSERDECFLTTNYFAKR